MKASELDPSVVRRRAFHGVIPVAMSLLAMLPCGDATRATAQQAGPSAVAEELVAEPPPALKAISEIKRDADGDWMVDRLGERVRLEGIVTYEPYFARGAAETRAYLQDESGAIRLLAAQPSVFDGVGRWDRIRVEGAVGQDKGMELVQVDRVEVLGPGQPLEPQSLTLAQVNARAERLTGTLARLRGVPRLYGDNLYLTDGTDRFRLYLRSSISEPGTYGRLLEDGREVVATGLIEQNDSGTPPQDGYRLTPRSMDGVIQSAPSPLVAIPAWIWVGAAVVGCLLGLYLGVERRRSRRLQWTVEQLRLAERARRDSEARFRSLIENALDIITVLGEDGRVRFESPSVERVLGYPPGHLLGRSVTEFVHPEEHEHVVTALASVRELGRPEKRIEFRALHADGSWRLLEAVGQVVDASAGDVEVVVNSRDITERRRLEREILEVSGREQRRLGQDLHDGMGQILVGARLHAAALGRRMAGHPEADDVERIGAMLDEAHTAARALARGLSPVSLEDGGLEAGLGELAERARHIQGIPCAFECPEPVAIRDLEVATQVYRIAQEAVSNATKHASPEAIQVRLTRSNGTAALVVEDDGSGFDGSDEGTGMGLSIMRHRAVMIGGSLRIEARESGGTRVRCQFPVPEMPVEAENDVFATRDAWERAGSGLMPTGHDGR